MKAKLLTTISFFTYQLSVSQSEKLLHGKVFYNNNPINNVEVINKTAKISTKTNDSGEFAIAVNVKDSLLFFAKNFHFTRLQITEENRQTDCLIVDIIPKPEELNEVMILDKKTTTIKLSKEEIRNFKLKPHKSKPKLKIEGYKEFDSPMDADFIYLAKLIYYTLRKKEEKPKVKVKKIGFVELIKKTIKPDFFDKDLKLQPEEKELFLDFCDADPQSKILSENPNILYLMDFLYAKNEEFKKLK